MSSLRTFASSSSISDNVSETNESLMEIENEIAAEAELLKKIQGNVENVKKYSPPSPTDQKEIDSRSVYVGNVDYNSTTEELEKHFLGCGQIVRITIPKDVYTKRQKNHAFVEFENAESVEMALVMNGSTFRNRQIAVTVKRTNRPGMGGSSIRGAPKFGRGGARGGRGGQQTVVVKYVYVNGPAPARGGRGRRFNPYK